MENNKAQQNKLRMDEIKAAHARQKKYTVLFIIAIFAMLGFIILRTSLRRPQPPASVLNIPSELLGGPDNARAVTQSLIKVIEAVTAEQVRNAAREYKNSSTQTKAAAIDLVLKHINSTPQESEQLRSIMEKMLSLKSIDAMSEQINTMSDIQFNITFPVYKKAVITYLQKSINN